MLEEKRTKIAYFGKTRDIVKIWLINILLNIVTLGIYSFWGRVRIRRYIIGSLSLFGDRFEYTGTGKELFIGFLKAFPVLIIFYSPFFIWDQKQYPLVSIALIPLFVLFYLGMYMSLRYKYSRITWRGIRGRLAGSPLDYAWISIFHTIINVITVGLLIPYSDIRTKGYIINNSYFGSQKAEFNGKASKIFFTHIITWLLFIPTIGFSRFWYRAKLARYIYESTAIGNVRLEGGQTAFNMYRLLIGNILIILFTFGLGAPFIVQRNMKYFCRTLTIIGEFNTSEIKQSEEKIKKSGEGIEGIIGDSSIGW